MQNEEGRSPSGRAAGLRPQPRSASSRSSIPNAVYAVEMVNEMAAMGVIEPTDRPRFFDQIVSILNASGIETEGEDAKRIRAEHESPARESGDAQTPSGDE